MAKTKERQEDSFPPISKALMNELERRCPEKCPELGMSDREIWFYAGQRQIVRLIAEAYKEQNENILI
jgi:hypothetical protein